MLIIANSILAVILLILIIARIIDHAERLPNYQANPIYGASIQVTENPDDEHGNPVYPDLTASIDPKLATPAAAFDYVYAILNHPTNIMGRSMSEDGNLDLALFTENVNTAISRHDITDPVTLSLFELERARIYAIYHNTERARYILDKYQEECNLTNAQLGFLYRAEAAYARVNDDESTALEYDEKYHQLPSFDAGEN